MPRAHGGRESVVKLDDSGGTLRTISVDVTNVDAPTNVDSAEVSGFSEARKSYIAGQIDTPIGIQGNFNSLGTTGAHAVVSSLIGGTAGYSFEYYPKGTATGMPKLAGEVLLTGYQVTSPLGGAVTWQASLVPADSTGIVWSTV